jgi:hypothetical protein
MRSAIAQRQDRPPLQPHDGDVRDQFALAAVLGALRPDLVPGQEGGKDRRLEEVLPAVGHADDVQVVELLVGALRHLDADRVADPSAGAVA